MAAQLGHSPEVLRRNYANLVAVRDAEAFWQHQARGGSIAAGQPGDVERRFTNVDRATVSVNLRRASNILQAYAKRP